MVNQSQLDFCLPRGFRVVERALTTHHKTATEVNATKNGERGFKNIRENMNLSEKLGNVCSMERNLTFFPQKKYIKVYGPLRRNKDILN